MTETLGVALIVAGGVLFIALTVGAMTLHWRRTDRRKHQRNLAFEQHAAQAVALTIPCEPLNDMERRILADLEAAYQSRECAE